MEKFRTLGLEPKTRLFDLLPSLAQRWSPWIATHWLMFLYLIRRAWLIIEHARNTGELYRAKTAVDKFHPLIIEDN